MALASDSTLEENTDVNAASGGFDPQGGLSLGLGVNAHSLPLEQTVYYALMTPTANVDEIVLIKD